MLVVSIAGSPSVRSRSGVLLERARDWLSRRGVEVASHQVLDFPAEDLLRARLDSPPVLALAEQIGRRPPSIDTSVLLDLLPERALEHKVVLPFATGGSSAHMLAVDYALKPVLAALKAQEVLHGVFAVDKQIAYATESDPARLEPVLEQRLENALETFHLALSRRPQPIDPQLLNERLVNARWSI